MLSAILCVPVLKSGSSLPGRAVWPMDQCSSLLSITPPHGREQHTSTPRAHHSPLAVHKEDSRREFVDSVQFAPPYITDEHRPFFAELSVVFLRELNCLQLTLAATAVCGVPRGSAAGTCVQSASLVGGKDVAV